MSESESEEVRVLIDLVGGPLHGEVHEVMSGWATPNRIGLPSEDKRVMYWYDVRPFENAADYTGYEMEGGNN